MSQPLTSREDQLLQVATRLFEAIGYHNTSTQDAADALGRLQMVSTARRTLVSRGRHDENESTKEKTLWP
jgi:hypothetical protein